MDEPADERGREERDDRRDDEGPDDGRDGRPRREGEAHPAASPNRPGTGKRPTISATSPARAAFAVGVVAPGDGLGDEAGDRAHLVRARSRGSSWRGCRAGCPDEVFGGSGSNGMAFLLTVIPISSRRCSASLPVTPSGVTSTRSRWLSVPPETIRAPRSARPSASSAAFSMVRCWSRRKSSPAARQQPDGLAGDHVHQRPALDAGEDRLVDLRRERRLDARVVGRIDRVREVLAAEDQAAATAAERLVGRRGDDVRVRERARMDARGDEAGDVGHVDHQQRADAVGDRGHALEVPEPRVGRGAADDELRADLLRGRRHQVVVDPLGVPARRRRGGSRRACRRS